MVAILISGMDHIHDEGDGRPVGSRGVIEPAGKARWLISQVGGRQEAFTEKVVDW